jgi:3-deoxy-7-phosphoheptulonate synthase
VESHLVAGRQDQVAGKPLRYGQSITDACIDWSTSVVVLDRLAKAVEQRRAAREDSGTARQDHREPLTSRA